MTKIQNPRRYISVRNLCTVNCYPDSLKWSKQPSHATVPLSRIISKTFSLLYTPYNFSCEFSSCALIYRGYEILVKCIKRISLLCSGWYWQIVEEFSLFYTCIHNFPFGQHKCKMWIYGCSIVHAEFRAQVCKRFTSPGIDSKESTQPAYVKPARQIRHIDS